MGWSLYNQHKLYLERYAKVDGTVKYTTARRVQESAALMWCECTVYHGKYEHSINRDMCVLCKGACFEVPRYEARSTRSTNHTRLLGNGTSWRYSPRDDIAFTNLVLITCPSPFTYLYTPTPGCICCSIFRNTYLQPCLFHAQLERLRAPQIRRFYDSPLHR